MNISLCPCSSGKSYQDCCKPYHEGKRAENALKLMRSRFTAYALNLSAYIIETTHPANHHYSDNKFVWKRTLSQFSKSTSFDKLEILDFKENDTFASVTFTAYLTQAGNDCSFTEKSLFEYFQSRWLYRGGQLEEGHAPNLVTTDQLRLLPLAYYGDPILRKKAEPVIEITEDIKKLVEEMVETMDACNGVGIAAPQVHHSIRLFVYRRPIESEETEYYSLGEVKVFINPTISSRSTETWKAPEGCLSIPSIRADVERSKEIWVEYTDLEGEKKKEKFSGWEAKVIQHETDHIEGVFFIDRLSEKEQHRLAPSLNALKKRIHDGFEM